MMGGDIAVESEAGQGSIFTVRLPAAAEGADPARPAQPEASRAVSRQVLVIDDDPAVAQIMEHFLFRQGYGALVAKTGLDGLRLARAEQPHAITLDIMLPDLDGWTVLAALKGDPELAPIPVILLSIVDERARGFALGATDYLTKPIDRTRLARVLRELNPRPGGRLLLVEDDADARTIVRETLAGGGWTLDEAADGRAGLDQLRRHRPDAILLDLMMPEMDGFEFLDALRRSEAWQSIPVLVMTAKDLSRAERELLDGGVRRILQKGLNSQKELLDELAALLRRSTSVSILEGGRP
jgi:CheY-like chemotaxis protein